MRVWALIRSARLATTQPTPSIIAKVPRWRMSSTAKEKRGGMKK
jgi:hypothetical protein